MRPAVRNDSNQREDKLFSAGWANTFNWGDIYTLKTDLSYSRAERDQSVLELYAGRLGGQSVDFNLRTDPYERADITSNTYWDWQVKHAGQVYGTMDKVFQFVATFDEFPPRSFPPSFNPANLMEAKMRAIRAERALREAFPMLPAAEPAN